ncbi:hypothetical protein BJ165DRAFT_833215 [Panaeolus papilionaceus]|nr:hypothetical protein BJ165DRAFT_833215 [Panaeolus papilionaceus]
MLNSANSTSATQAKERLYAQLAGNLGRMSRAVGQTADLCEQLQIDLHAMRIFAGLDAAKFMTIAANLNEDGEDEEAGQQAAAHNKKVSTLQYRDLGCVLHSLLTCIHNCHSSDTFPVNYTNLVYENRQV